MDRWLTILCLALLAAGPARAEALRAPFPPPAAFACPPGPAPVRDLRPEPFYTDPAYSIVDPKLAAAEAEATRPVRDFHKALTASVDAHRAGRAGAAACALALLDGWAREGALTGEVTRQGGYWRKWTLAGVALDFLAIRDAAGLDGDAQARVLAWLGQLAAPVRAYYSRRPPADPKAISDLRNNHASWAALAIAAAGVATGDRAMLAWGMEKGQEGLRQVTAEGALPLELARGRQALHYHMFTLEPLAALARLGAANGMGFAPEDAAALDRLARFTFAAARDPARIAALAGVAQDDHWLHGRSPLVMGAGLEIWAAERDMPEVSATLAPFRPFREPWLGGNVTQLWRPAP